MSVSEDQNNTFIENLEIRKVAAQYLRVNSLRSLTFLSLDWGIIVSSVYLCDKYFSPFLYIITVFIIGGRQQALGVLMHDAAHMKFLKNPKMNDWVSDLFMAWPGLLSTAAYRANHIAHHLHTNTQKDPDWSRKAGQKDWVYPRDPKSIRLMLAKFAFRGGLDWILLAWMISRGDKRTIVYWAAVITLAAYTGFAEQLAIYWFVPLLTVLPWVQRVRSISEHFGLPYTHALNGTRNILASPLELFFLAPHNVNYHLTHHLFPAVPSYYLKELHQKLMQFSDYRDHTHCNDGYFWGRNSVWKDISKQSSKPLIPAKTSDKGVA